MEDRYLYKAKRVDNGEWIIGSLITGVFHRSGQDIPYILCPDQADYDCFEDFSEGNGIFEVDPATLCRLCHPDFDDAVAKVELNAVCFEWNGYELFPCIDENGISDVAKMERAGNIFDNPELLEV